MMQNKKFLIFLLIAVPLSFLILILYVILQDSGARAQKDINAAATSFLAARWSYTDPTDEAYISSWAKFATGEYTQKYRESIETIKNSGNTGLSKSLTSIEIQDVAVPLPKRGATKALASATIVLTDEIDTGRSSKEQKLTIEVLKVGGRWLVNSIKVEAERNLTFNLISE